MLVTSLCWWQMLVAGLMLLKDIWCSFGSLVGVTNIEIAENIDSRPLNNFQHWAADYFLLWFDVIVFELQEINLTAWYKTNSGSTPESHNFCYGTTNFSCI